MPTTYTYKEKIVSGVSETYLKINDTTGETRACYQSSTEFKQYPFSGNQSSYVASTQAKYEDCVNQGSAYGLTNGHPPTPPG